MGVDSFYVCALPPDQAYLVVTGKMQQLDLPNGLPRGWLDRHSCIAIANRQRRKDHPPLVVRHDLKDLIAAMPREDKRLLYFDGILGTVEVLACEYKDSNWYRFHLGRTKFLYWNPFPLKWRNQLKELPSEDVAKFLEHTGYETW